jgi:hypothetical protein
MFLHGDLVVHKETGAVARFSYVHTASYPALLVIGNWPKGTELPDHPGHIGVPHAQCALFIGPKQEGPRHGR